MPLLDLFQMPDQMRMVASFLDVHELLALYRSNKEIRYSIPYEIVAQCREDTETRYTRAIFMPDSFIRVFSRYGRHVYDIYAIPEGLTRRPDSTEHLLKSPGRAIQKNVPGFYKITNADGTTTDVTEDMNLFNAREIHTSVYHVDTQKSIDIRLMIEFNDSTEKVFLVLLSFYPCTPYAPFDHSERTIPTRKANPKRYPAFML
jgi:hypothetical protein